MTHDPLIGNLVIGTDTRGSGIVVMKFPGRDGAIVAYAAGDVDNTCGAEVSPGKFFLASPDHFHWALGGPGETCRFDRSFSGVLAAVTGAGVGHQYAHVIFRNAEGLGELPANAEGTLRSGPYSQLIAVPLGKRGAGFERNMCDVGNRVGLLQFVVGGSQRRVDRARVVSVAVSGGIFALNRIFAEVVE